MGYGTLSLKIEELLKEKDISKNRICKDLDIPRSNFNRYCRNECQRLDIAMLCKLLHYLEVDVSDLLLYQRENQTDGDSNVTPVNAKPVELQHTHKEISMYNDTYEKIRDILTRLYPVFDELEMLYNELCTVEDAHKKHMDSIEYDDEGEDLSDKLNTATSELSSAFDYLESALQSIDQCIPESE